LESGLFLSDTRNFHSHLLEHCPGGPLYSGFIFQKKEPAAKTVKGRFDPDLRDIRMGQSGQQDGESCPFPARRLNADLPLVFFDD
jgi:hypothetical protein